MGTVKKAAQLAENLKAVRRQADKIRIDGTKPAAPEHYDTRTAPEIRRA
jgi:hypothetical protein